MPVNTYENITMTKFNFHNITHNKPTIRRSKIASRRYWIETGEIRWITEQSVAIRLHIGREAANGKRTHILQGTVQVQEFWALWIWVTSSGPDWRRAPGKVRQNHAVVPSPTNSDSSWIENRWFWMWCNQTWTMNGCFPFIQVLRMVILLSDHEEGY